MQVNPDHLRELRKRKKFSRADLAEQSKISVRQITRLENGSAGSGAPRDRTVNQLATALGVEPDVLLGDLPLPEAPAGSKERIPSDQRIQVSALLSSENHLAYTLIKRRYGVNFITLFNAAPLMFVLLAESSLIWRREKKDEIEAAAEELRSLSESHLSFGFSTSHAKNWAIDEGRSIEKRDIFGNDVREKNYNILDGCTPNNPFVHYLCELAEKINDIDIVEIFARDPSEAAQEDFPEFQVCNGDLGEISGNSMKASTALRFGYVRIGDIPDELWADDATDQRKQWIEDRFRENEPAFFDTLSSIQLNISQDDEKEAGQ